METWLMDAAFGVDPRGDVRRPGPGAPGLDVWLWAVWMGGRGGRQAAQTELSALGAHRDPLIRSLAWSTSASLIRQRGRHAAAAPLDGWAIAVADPGRVRGDPGRMEAAEVDALVGLAADHLGLGRVDVALRLIDTAAARADGWGPREWVWGDRVRLRVQWVLAECGLYGDDAASAARHAERARELASECPSVRHVIKTEMIWAAARAAAGDPATALATAASARDDAARCGLRPLAAACGQLLDGLARDARGAARDRARSLS
ncbi:hypothetical protein [Williamsia sterculiae]|uniref:Uncharacterized protein n=1 Tax=Williamsia sterculiae TaxID=1344003 RepID=A0A1N7DV08_9NOCA|nr:hypothetical protein [Williamsia sterculiae]SIR79638.1 hypothetical protein SAMN05445060_0925 [Williamsia sterculiae]